MALKHCTDNLYSAAAIYVPQVTRTCLSILNNGMTSSSGLADNESRD